MKILNIKHFSPSFASTGRTTYINNFDGIFTLSGEKSEQKHPPKADTKMLCSNSTSFFREDIDWRNIGRIFQTQFPKGQVNVYDFACSDGSEAYSLIIALIEQLGEQEASRFFPINASDIDFEIIKTANSGKIIATDDDLRKISQATGGKIGKYFDPQPLDINKVILYPKEILRKNVSFNTKSISQGLNETQDGDKIILCRNFWKYLSQYELEKSAWELGCKTDPNSLVLVGAFDFEQEQFPFFLDALGFDYHIDSQKTPNIFRPQKSPRTQDAFKKFVDLKYSSYIPPYIGRN